MTPRRSPKFGFTLIELLVVIAVVAVLVGILIPALTRARERVKEVDCQVHLRSIFQGVSNYMQHRKKLPTLNNEPNEGSWQYNYLIWDGSNYDNCWGPVADPDAGYMSDNSAWFCPVQTNPGHIIAPGANDWPPKLGEDTNSSYGRRHGLSNLDLKDQIKIVAFAADVFHVPGVIKSGHDDGVNVVYTDGHVTYIKDKLLQNSGLTSPFDPSQNPLVEAMWDVFDTYQTGK